MKFFITAALTLLSVSASAAEVTGRASLTLWMDRESGPYNSEIRMEGNTVLGHSSLGRSGMFSLKAQNGGWKGFAPTGRVQISCEAEECRGTVSSNTTRASVRDSGASIEGVMNHNRFTVDRTATEIRILSEGTLELRKTADGAYEGRGALNLHPFSTFRAKLKTSGTLKDLNDPALLMIFLVSPFAE